MGKTTRLEPIRPGIVLEDGTTYYPTGEEWLLAFALKGCEWAARALEEIDWKRLAERPPPGYDREGL
jgi:hypothetical protein